MKNTLVLMMLAFLAVGQSACQTTKEALPTTRHANTSGYQDLYARNFSNAVVTPGGWVWDGDVLVAKDHSTLWTKDSYGNFVLDMEFKVDPGANSGLFIRTANPDDILSALEIQIHETNDGTPHGQVGAVYDVLSPSTDATRPAGQWNRYTITAKDNMIYVVMNGKQIIDMDLDKWTTPRKNPDGSNNKFSRALKDQARTGPIGLQGIHGKEGSNVYFRNLKITKLD